jgi:hypothetical protein
LVLKVINRFLYHVKNALNSSNLIFNVVQKASTHFLYQWYKLRGFTVCEIVISTNRKNQTIYYFIIYPRKTAGHLFCIVKKIKQQYQKIL